MKRIVAFLAVVGIGWTVGGAPASADAPHDTEIAALLVAPSDPAFAESTGAGAVVGPLAAESVPAMSAPFPLPAADGLRGGFARLFTADGRSAAEVGYDLGTADAASAQAARLTEPAAGEAPFEPLAIAGATGLTARTNPTSDPPYSFLAFASGTRFFVVTVTGADPGHELLFRQAAAIGAAAVASPGVPATTAPVATASRATTAASAPHTTLAENRSFKARWNDVVHDENTDRFLVVASALLALVLLNRAVNAHRRRGGRSRQSTGPVRQSQAAWTPTAGAWPTLGTERFPVSDEPAFPTAPGQPAPGTPAKTMLGGPTAGADVLPIDAYTGSRTAGWGDEEPAPAPAEEPLPPLPSRARTPKPTRAGPGMLAPDPSDARPAPPAPAPRPGTPSTAPIPPAAPAPLASPSPWTVSESLGDEEHYSFPGAESWPGDPVGGTPA